MGTKDDRRQKIHVLTKKRLRKILFAYGLSYPPRRVRVGKDFAEKISRRTVETHKLHRAFHSRRRRRVLLRKQEIRRGKRSDFCHRSRENRVLYAKPRKPLAFDMVRDQRLGLRNAFRAVGAGQRRFR